MSDNLKILPLSAHAAKWVYEQYQYGDTVLHDDLWDMLEVPEPVGRVQPAEYRTLTLKRMSLVADTRDRLLEDYSVYTVCVRGEGYKLAFPSEQTDVVGDELDKSFKKHVLKAAKGFLNIDTETLTEDQLQSNIIARQRVVGLSSMLRRERRLSKIAPKELPHD